MANVKVLPVSGNPLIDGITSSNYWDLTLATGSNGVITYSFTTAKSDYGSNLDFYGSGEVASSATFAECTASQKAMAREAFRLAGLELNCTFTELTGGSVGSATIRIAQSNVPSTSWAYYPDPSDLAGDVWMGSAVINDAPGPCTAGTYHGQTMPHEIGHALNLKHGGAAIGDEINHPALPDAHNAIFWTIMTYRAYVGAGDTGWSIDVNPHPYMPIDWQALKYMYGEKSSRADRTYTPQPSTGAMDVNGTMGFAPTSAKMLTNIPKSVSGCSDTLDASLYSGKTQTINMQADSWSTLDSSKICSTAGGNAPGNICTAPTGVSFHNVKTGTGGSCRVVGNASCLASRIDCNGTDTYVFPNTRVNTRVSKIAAGHYRLIDKVTGKVDHVYGGTTLEFSDASTVAFSTFTAVEIGVRWAS